MKIDYSQEKPRYFDVNGEEITEGCEVMLNGKREKVYLTEDGMLGTDATNPIWIEKERAVPCEYGIYPFNEQDKPVLVKQKENNIKS